MYLGSPSGATVLREDDGRFVLEATALEGMDVRSIAVSEHDGSLFAQVGDTIHRSNDSGGTWTPVLAPTGKISALVSDRTSPGTVYVGTEPVALYRSRDAGATWEEIVSLRCQPEAIRDTWWGPAYPHQGHVRDICVDPSDPRRIYVALEHGGVMRSDDDGGTWEWLAEGFETLDIHVVQV